MRFPGVCALALMLGTMGFAQQQSEISGEYLEVRSNHVFGCYCEWSGEAITGGREAILAWNIKSGEFSGVSLAGVKIVAVVVGERNLSVGFPPRKSVLFLDETDSRKQQQAAQDLIRSKYGPLLGDILKIHLVPIGFHQNDDIADVSAGEIVNVTMQRSRLPEDALPGSKYWYDPFIPLMGFTLGTTLKNRYQGEDFNPRWDVSDSSTSGYYGRFLLTIR